MSHHERFAWVHAVSTLLVAAYFTNAIVSQRTTTTLANVDFQIPTIIAVIAMIILMVTGSIGVAIITAIQSHLRGDDEIHRIDRRDERDDAIHRLGDVTHQRITSVALIGVFALVAFELPHAYVAMALFATLTLAELGRAGRRIVAYRTGA